MIEVVVVVVVVIIVSSSSSSSSSGGAETNIILRPSMSEYGYVSFVSISST